MARPGCSRLDGAVRSPAPRFGSLRNPVGVLCGPSRLGLVGYAVSVVARSLALFHTRQFLVSDHCALPLG
eukprot:13269730-Alexandrium_andersonii.AAC.1